MANSINLNSIGKRIRYIREGRGLTLEEFASELHMKPEYLDEIEKGWIRINNPNNRIFRRICSQYRVSPNWLMNGEGIPYEDLPFISKRIILYRHSNNIVRADFAAKTGVSKEMIQKIERGLTGPTWEELWKICAACNVSVEWLTGEKDRRKQRETQEAEKEAREMGARLAHARKELGVTREEMAEAIGTSAESIRAFEEDGQDLGRLLIKKIPPRFGISYDWILFGVGDAFFEVEEAKKIAEWMKSIRRMKGLTQDALAEILGISREEIFQFENCINMPEEDILKKTGELLDAPAVKCSLEPALPPDKEAVEMGERFAQARRELGSSRETMAEAVQVSVEQIHKFEEEGAALNPLTLKMICREFGISYDWIMFGAGDILFDVKTAETIAEWMRSIRRKAGLTQYAFAKKLGASKEEISLYENCLNLPGVEFLEKASEMVGVPVVKCALTASLPPDKEAVEIGERFAQARRELGVSMETMAEAANVSIEQIREFEEGEVPSPQTLKMLCREFGISYNWIMQGCGGALFDKKKIEVACGMADTHSQEEISIPG